MMVGMDWKARSAFAPWYQGLISFLQVALPKTQEVIRSLLIGTTRILMWI